MRLDGPQGVGQPNVQQARVESNGSKYPVEALEQEQTFNTSGAIAKQNLGKGYAMQFEGNDNAFSNAPKYTEADFQYTTSANGKKVKTGFSKAERQKLATEYNKGNRDIVDPYGDVQKYLVKENNPIADSYLDELAAYKPKAPFIQPTYDETLDGIRQDARELQQNIKDVRSGYEEAKEKSRIEAKIDRNAGLTLGVGAALTDQIDQATGAVLASNDEQTRELKESNEKQTEQLEGDIKKGNATILKEVKATKKEVEATKKDVKATKQAVNDQGVRTRKTVVKDGDKTRKKVTEESDRVINNLDPIGTRRLTRRVIDGAGEVIRGAEEAAENIVDGIVRGGRILFD